MISPGELTLIMRTITKQVPDGPLLHFFYQKGENYASKWQEGQDYIVKAFQFMNKNFGKYPYKHFYVIQGGDGGMEYAMSTMITGNRSLGKLCRSYCT